MNTLKKLFSLCLAVMLVLSMAVPVMAEDAPVYTITLLDPADNHQYEAYQIFSGEYADGVLSTVEWGKNFNTANVGEFINALKTNAVFGSVFGTLKDNATAGDVASMLASQNLAYDAELTQHFADLLHDHTKTNDGEIVYTYLLKDSEEHTVVPSVKGSKKDDKFQYTFSVPAGYYLIKDVDGSQEDKHDFYTRLLLQVAGNATIAPKGAVPSVKKHVNHTINGTYTQATDMSMLGEVYFKLEGTLPDNYDKYETYTYSFVDTLPVGLDFDNVNDFQHSMNTEDNTDDIIGMGGVVECYIQHNTNTTTFVNIGTTGGLVLDKYEDKTNDPDRGDLYFNYVENENGTKTLTIKFYDLKETFPYLLDDDVIVVKYAAKVNTDAAIGKGTVSGDIANENTVVLEFSNNPQGDGMGKTVEDTAEVYTYQLNINKVDDTDRTVSLDGAIFLLGNKFMQTGRAQVEAENPGPVVDNEFDYMYPVFTVDDKNNSYTLSGGVVTDVPIRDYKIETVDGVNKYYALDQNGHPIKEVGKDTNLELNNIMMVSKKDNPIKIIGLDSGSYLLRELKAPAGYNKITDTITVVITAEHNAETGALTTFKVHALGEDVQGITDTGVLPLALTNTKGSVLPSTGGIGTTIFYIAGGIMAVAAIVLLITKKRMSEY